MAGPLIPALVSKASIPAPDDPSVSQGPFEFVGLDPDAAHRFLWQTMEGGQPTVTRDRRVVGQMLEVCQWPYPQGDLPARTLWACIWWSDPSAAAADDLAVGGHPIRLLAGD